MAQSSEAKVRAWLQEKGSGFELQTARAFIEGGAHDVQHSRYYVDPAEAKVRETDVVATCARPSTGGWISLNYVVECKTTTEPWVLFTSEQAVYTQDYDVLNTFEARYFGGVEQRNMVQNPQGSDPSVAQAPCQLGCGHGIEQPGRMVGYHEGD